MQDSCEQPDSENGCDVGSGGIETGKTRTSRGVKDPVFVRTSCKIKQDSIPSKFRAKLLPLNAFASGVAKIRPRVCP